MLYALTDSFSLSLQSLFSFIYHFHLNLSCWDRFRHWPFILLVARWNISFIPFLPTEGQIEQILGMGLSHSLRNKTFTAISPNLARYGEEIIHPTHPFGIFLDRFRLTDIISHFGHFKFWDSSSSLGTTKTGTEKILCLNISLEYKLLYPPSFPFPQFHHNCITI